MRRPFVVVASMLLGVALATPALAHEAGKWVVRGGVGMVMPKDNNVTLPQLSIPPVTIDGTVQVDDGTSFTLTGTYMFTENWALDILAAWPFTHDIDLDGTFDDGTGPVSGNVPFGEVTHLPPTFSVQYHFAPNATFQPYVGLGLNYTMFSSEKLNEDVVDLGILDFSVDDSFGIAAQVGADWVFDSPWLINFDVRWVNIESDLSATIDFGAGPQQVEIPDPLKIDPWVVAIGIGYKY